MELARGLRGSLRYQPNHGGFVEHIKKCFILFYFTFISHQQGQYGFLFLGTFSENRMSSRVEDVISLPVVTGSLCPATIPSRK